MRKITSLKFISMRFIFLILGFGIGLLIIAQFRTVPDRVANPETPVLSLFETRNMLYKEQEDLKNEMLKLSSANLELDKEIKNKNISQQSIADLEEERKKAGLTEIRGGGLVITLDDSLTGPAGEDSIIHAADLRDLINYLWSGGARAISINDQRLVFTSSIDCVVNTILVNNTKISNPFIVKAIGDSERMQTVINSPINLVDLKNRRKGGVTFEYKKTENIIISPYLGTFSLTAGELS